jgi:hypothetical protein
MLLPMPFIFTVDLIEPLDFLDSGHS